MHHSVHVLCLLAFVHAEPPTEIEPGCTYSTSLTSAVTDGKASLDLLGQTARSGTSRLLPHAPTTSCRLRSSQARPMRVVLAEGYYVRS